MLVLRCLHCFVISDGLQTVAAHSAVFEGELFVFPFICWQLTEKSKLSPCKVFAEVDCLPSDVLLSLPVKGSQRGQHPSSWRLLLLMLFSPPEAVWERTWHVPYAVICSESLSCWPACTISANLAYPGTGEERRGLSPAHNAARSSAPSSFKLTTLWQPWWRRSVPLPRMLTPRT